MSKKSTPVSFIAVSSESFEDFKEEHKKLLNAIEKNLFLGKQNFTAVEACEFLAISRPLFDNAIKQGLIKPVNHTDKRKTYLLEDLMKYLRLMRDN